MAFVFIFRPTNTLPHLHSKPIEGNTKVVPYWMKQGDAKLSVYQLLSGEELQKQIGVETLLLHATLTSSGLKSQEGPALPLSPLETLPLKTRLKRETNKWSVPVH